MKFILEGWGDEAEDREAVVDCDLDNPPDVFFEEFGFSCLVEELERLIRFVKTYKD